MLHSAQAILVIWIIAEIEYYFQKRLALTNAIMYNILVRHSWL